jgi:hypothetical protein
MDHLSFPSGTWIQPPALKSPCSPESHNFIDVAYFLHEVQLYFALIDGNGSRNLNHTNSLLHAGNAQGEETTVCSSLAFSV